MATYSATNYDTAPVPGHGLSNTLKVIPFTVTASAALTDSDDFQFGYVPAGFRLTGAILEADDLDTDGSPALAFNVGDADDEDRIFAASDVGQAGTSATTTDVAVAGLGYRFADKTLITGAVSTSAATGAAGDVRLYLIGYIDNSATS